jgi:hypothetical protein
VSAPGVTFVGDLGRAIGAAGAAAGDKCVNALGAEHGQAVALDAGELDASACSSRPYCSATALACSTVPARPASSWSASGVTEAAHATNPSGRIVR